MLLRVVSFMVVLGVCFAARRPDSDSILDLINTQEVERIIAERRENMTRIDRQYLMENNLDNIYQPPPPEYEYNTRVADEDRSDQKSGSTNHRIDIDVLLKKNNNSEPLAKTELLDDLRGFNGRKVLKSSKNALLVTNKEYLKKDWCKSEPLVQKIKEEGCLTRTVINRFCYGQCNSFYIPKNPKKRKLRESSEENDELDENGPAFKSCGVCRPMKFTWVTVILRCPAKMPMLKKKRIQRIKQCRCVAADVD